MCTQDVTGRLYTAVISRNWAKKLCISHLCSRVQPQHAKSNMCFAIASLIAGFVLLQIFAGKPNNSSSRTKHFASFLLGSDLSSFLSFFASFFFFFFCLIIVSSLQTELEVALFYTSEVPGDFYRKSQSCLKAFITLEGAVPNVYVLSEGSDKEKKKVQLPDLCTCSSSQLEAKSSGLH